MAEFSKEITLETLECHTCGILFAIPASYIANRKEDHEGFKCPNGDSLAYPKKTEDDKNTQIAALKKKVEKLEAEVSELSKLKTKNITLLAQLDQAKAKASQLEDTVLGRALLRQQEQEPQEEAESDQAVEQQIETNE